MSTNVQAQADDVIAKDLLIAAMESSRGMIISNDPAAAAEQIADAYAVILKGIKDAHS